MDQKNRNAGGADRRQRRSLPKVHFPHHIGVDEADADDRPECELWNPRGLLEALVGDLFKVGKRRIGDHRAKAWFNV
jgi:hypothetical protein